LIFVTVGLHFQGFDRLVKHMDSLAPRLDEPVVMQIGYSAYEPRHARFFRFAANDDVIRDLIRASRVVVSHAGIGTILRCAELGRPIIIVPRRKALGEHVDDHQMEIVRMSSSWSFVTGVEDLRDITVEFLNQPFRFDKRVPSSSVGDFISKWLEQEKVSPGARDAYL